MEYIQGFSFEYDVTKRKRRKKKKGKPSEQAQHAENGSLLDYFYVQLPTN